MTLWTSLTLATTNDPSDEYVVKQAEIYRRMTQSLLFQSPLCQPKTAADPGLIIRARPAQAGNLLQLENESGGVILDIDAAGTLNLQAINILGGAHVDYLSVGTAAIPSGGTMIVGTRVPGVCGMIIVAIAGQTAHLQEWQDPGGVPLTAITANGGLLVGVMADVAAANETVYYSTDALRLVFKDGAGVIHALY